MSGLQQGKGFHQQADEINISAVFSQLRENIRLIIALVVISLAVGIFYTSRQVPLYQSEILLQVKSSREGGASSVSGLLSQFKLDVGGDNAESTQIVLMKSPYILLPVVKSLSLDIQAGSQKSILNKLFFPLLSKIEVKEFDLPAQYVNKNYSLVYDREKHYQLYDSEKKLILMGRIGELVTGKDGTIHLLINSIIAPLHTRFNIKKIPPLKVVESLKNKLNVLDLGTKLDRTGVLRLSLIDPNPEKVVLILNDIGQTVQAKDIESNAIEASKTLEFLYQQLPITKLDLEKAETLLNQYRAKSRKIDIKLQSKYLLEKLTGFDEQLSTLKIDRIDKLQAYTSEHPIIIALNTKIREINAERHKLEVQLTKLPASDQVAVNLMRDVQVKSSLYTLLLKKIQELQVIKAGIVSNVRILSKASVPYEALPMKRGKTILLFAFTGLFLSVLIIFIRKVMYACVEDPHWGERNIGLTNLAIVPYSKEQSLKIVNEYGNTVLGYPLLAHVNSWDLAIESLRSLRTSLQIRLNCESNNIVSILGLSPSVGKTFVTANLAYLLAVTGKRVVMIDTDMRRGMLHKYFNVKPSLGLAEVLNAKETLEKALLLTKVNDNLFILPRGGFPRDPSELLTSEQFKNVVNTLSKQFDVVLIDTPPLLLVTDAVLIGVHAGTNYLVLGANAHQPSQIELSIKQLTNAGVSLNGSIFNFHKKAKLGSSGYYKYGYKHNYYNDVEVAK